MKLDESAILWSAPERERTGRPLLVLLHGYGSHEGDLFSLAPALPLDAVIASVRAPIAESGGWAWFSLAHNAPGAPDPDQVDAAANAVLDWLDTVESSSVSLIGFSQGAVTALQLLRLAPLRFSSVIALSGFLAQGPHVGDAALLAARPRVFWGRGTVDTIIPAEAFARTEQWLDTHASAAVHIYEGLGHSISTSELNDLVAFLGDAH